MTIEPATLVAIAAMAVVTWATRASGLWLVRFVPLTGRTAAALEAAPAAILMSVIAPAVFMSGAAEPIAAAVTLVAAFRTPLVVTVALGVATVVALRLLLG